MQAEILQHGDTIGIVAPSHVAERERYEPILAGIRARGFAVKTGENMYKATYGYLASEQERADDFNAMVRDPAVKMVFFGGGNGGAEVLPLLDYDAIARNPKLYVSYSDGTSILNAIYAKTGLITYYGQSPGNFVELTPYDETQFMSHFVRGGVTDFVPNSRWQTLTEGACEGTLIGGYTVNFALLMRGDYFRHDPNERYVLFLEDHEMFGDVAFVSAMLSHIEQSGFARSVAGLLFGHYSESVNEDLLGRLRRFGERYGVPVVYCDDFGHGANHAILPIGCRAALDATRHTLRFDASF